MNLRNTTSFLFLGTIIGCSLLNSPEDLKEPDSEASVETEIILEALHRAVGLQVAKLWEQPPLVCDAIGKHVNGRFPDEVSQGDFAATRVCEGAGDLCLVIGIGRRPHPCDALALPSLLDLGFDTALTECLLGDELPLAFQGVAELF